jgi:hypothetical protein
MRVPLYIAFGRLDGLRCSHAHTNGVPAKNAGVGGKYAISFICKIHHMQESRSNSGSTP